MKKIVPALIFAAIFMPACSKSGSEMVEICLAANSDGAAQNLNGDLNGVETAIRSSHELGLCLSSGLKLDALHSNRLKAQAVLDFVSQQVTYKVDETGTKFPAKTLKDKEGDCEDYTALTGAVLFASKVDFYLINRPPVNDGELGHIFLAIETEEDTGMECDGKRLEIGKRPAITSFIC